MNAIHKFDPFSDSIHERWTQLGERELSAFIGAVKELFGPEQARVSGEQWIDQLELMEGPLRCVEDWRAVTIAAAALLANSVKLSATSVNFAHRSEN